MTNNGFDKSTLLKSAVGVVHELMHDTDEIGLVRFDHESDVLLPMTPKSAGLGSALTGTALDPRGATSIAGGILVGTTVINGPGATHPNKAMVVVTDGNENADPKIPVCPPDRLARRRMRSVSACRARSAIPRSARFRRTQGVTCC